MQLVKSSRELKCERRLRAYVNLNKLLSHTPIASLAFAMDAQPCTARYRSWHPAEANATFYVC
jgi:hypothetical protein